MSESEVTYRPSLVTVFFGLFVFGTVSAAIAVVGLQRLGFVLPGIFSASFLWTLCLLWIWLLVCTPVVSMSYSFTVSARGIRGRTFWGRKRFLAWEDMNRVSRPGIPPFRFLRIRTNAGGPPMWIALFVSGSATLIRQLSDNAPDGHPVRDFV